MLCDYCRCLDKFRKDIDGKQIEYLGAIPHSEINKLFGKAKAFIFPIQWDEPFGMVFIEALASGTPVFTLKKGSASEIVINGETGYVAENEAELLEKVSKFEDFHKRKLCRKRVDDHFTIDRMIEQYDLLYKRLADEKN